MWFLLISRLRSFEKSERIPLCTMIEKNKDVLSVFAAPSKCFGIKSRKRFLIVAKHSRYTSNVGTLTRVSLRGYSRYQTFANNFRDIKKLSYIRLLLRNTRRCFWRKSRFSLIYDGWRLRRDVNAQQKTVRYRKCINVFSLISFSVVSFVVRQVFFPFLLKSRRELIMCVLTNEHTSTLPLLRLFFFQMLPSHHS